MCSLTKLDSKQAFMVVITVDNTIYCNFFIYLIAVSWSYDNAKNLI